MAASSWKHAIFLSALAYQAGQAYARGGAFVVPRGYRLVQTLGGADYPFLGFVLESRSRLIAVFRGSQDLRDLLTDFDQSLIRFPYAERGGDTHRGFTKLYTRAVREPLLRLLQRKKRKPLILAGFSLGAALATLAGLDITLHAKGWSPAVYTFGSPKVGDAAFAGAYDRAVPRSARVANRFDPVTRFPASTKQRPYTHVARKRECDFRRGLLLDNHKIRNYFACLAAKDPLYARQLAAANPGLCPVVHPIYPAPLSAPAKAALPS
ncbi:lipase [Paenibacillus sp. J31TS4]|nr:lipase [Paenibacillus sp. J31TS4]